MAPSRILTEIKQTKPFPSLEQEAIVAFFKTADHLRRGQASLFESHDITAQQYNVLRILRGAGEAGLPTLSIAERLVEQTPGITRLIDRLEAKRLVLRERPSKDRRQVYCRISDTGLELLGRLAPEVEAGARRSLDRLTKPELTDLLKILEKIRDSE